jgi:hypothetical protein
MEDCRSVSGYLRWRKMQYSLNWRAMAVLKDLADMSLLTPTSADYFESCLKKKPCIEAMLENDPFPDADVRFMTDGTARTSPASLLSSSAFRKSNKPVCVVVGVPNHVAAAIMWPYFLSRRRGGNKHDNKGGAVGDCVYERVEYFDSRGFNADKRHLKRIKAFFKQTASTADFVLANPDVDFQLADNDVCCQTWIYYFMYMRLAQRHDAKTICRAIQALRPAQRLDEVRKFQTWLFDGLQLVLEDRIDQKDVAEAVQQHKQSDVLQTGKPKQGQDEELVLHTEQPSPTRRCQPPARARDCKQINAGVTDEPDSVQKVHAFTVVNSHAYLLPRNQALE